MEVLNNSTYWTSEFAITEADVARIEAYIRRVRHACDLTELAKRVVRGRLRFGPESGPAILPFLSDPSVRLWDPAGHWEIGDHVIVGVMLKPLEEYKPFVGEVIRVDEHLVVVLIDALNAEKLFKTEAEFSADDLEKWRQAVRDLVYKKGQRKDIESRVEYVLFKHGEKVVTKLMSALRNDNRFVRLAGRWFLRELVVCPSEEQIASLAWAMVPLQEPKPTDALVRLVHPPLADGDAGLFGLYISMRERPELFKNVDPGLRPRWVLASTPPGSFVPNHAAYDPNTYEVICLPGRVASPNVVKRLWNLGLLDAVV